MDELQEQVHTGASLCAECYARVSSAFQFEDTIMEFVAVGRAAERSPAIHIKHHIAQIGVDDADQHRD